MKKFIQLSLAIAAATACSIASAGVVTFEGVDASIYSNGETIQMGEQLVTVRGQGGLDGAVINGSDVNSCSLAVCPSGNSTNYFTGLNDGGMSFKWLDGAFLLSSVDFGFVLPLAANLGNLVVGQLVITGDDGSQVARDFDLQVNGDYGFTHWDIGGVFGHTRFNEVTFSACLYTVGGGCVNPADNQAQFAIDNIGYVPEPASMSLVAVSLGGIFAAGRRRKSV